MNFKFLILLALLFGCGVKSTPKAPSEVAIPSYIDSYLNENEVQSLKDQHP